MPKVARPEQMLKTNRNRKFISQNPLTSYLDFYRREVSNVMQDGLFEIVEQSENEDEIEEETGNQTNLYAASILNIRQTWNKPSSMEKHNLSNSNFWMHHLEQ